jgi:hypothetical protein
MYPGKYRDSILNEALTASFLIRNFEGIYRLHREGGRVIETRNQQKQVAR